MLVLVIPQSCTSVLFVFNLRLHIIPAVIKIILINWVFEGLKKCNSFRLASALVETEAGHGTGSCMLCHLS